MLEILHELIDRHSGLSNDVSKCPPLDRFTAMDRNRYAVWGLFKNVMASSGSNNFKASSLKGADNLTPL